MGKYRKRNTLRDKAMAIEMYHSGHKVVYVAYYLHICRTLVSKWYKEYKGVQEGVVITLKSRV